MVKTFDARYYCIGCNKNFIGKRDMNKQNSVRCPKCHIPNNVVRFNHPYVKIALDKLKKVDTNV